MAGKAEPEGDRLLDKMKRLVNGDPPSPCDADAAADDRAAVHLDVVVDYIRLALGRSGSVTAMMAAVRLEDIRDPIARRVAGEIYTLHQLGHKPDAPSLRVRLLDDPAALAWLDDLVARGSRPMPMPKFEDL